MNNSTQNTAANEQELQQHLQQLPKELTPERDLWSGIERAINESACENTGLKKHNTVVKLALFKTPLAWTASVIVAVLLATQLNSWQLNQHKIPTAQTQQLGFDAVSFIQQNFNQQKHSLLVSYGNPDIKQLPTKMQQELQLLENAQIEISQALAKDKNNQNLLNLLQWTQQQELKLIEQLYRPRWQSI